MNIAKVTIEVYFFYFVVDKNYYDVRDALPRD